MSFKIGLMADHPEVLEQLAAAYERESPEWYGVHGDARADVRERSRRTGLPIGLVALERNIAVGALSIAERSARSHPHLSPWVVAFWVEPSRRRRGIGGQLLEAACEHARREGIVCLYASTAAASSLLARHGWLKIDAGMTDLGAETSIFSKLL
jgi:GNAT superfamily N-acetyltransferase